MPRPSRLYTLSAAILAANLGTGIMCLADAGQGRPYRLHAERPGPELNRRAVRCEGGRVEWRAGLPDGSAIIGAGGVVEPPTPKLILVRIDGPLEQRAGYHDPCDGWSDGHDAIAERLCAAFQEGDVLLMVDSPGGAAAGLQQAVERAQAAKVEHGRRVTVFADEMIGSAAMWWACTLGDELFLPVAGQVGSIGARGQHTSIKGALDKEGILVTYFADPPEKVCFAPERLPDEETIRRGTRDVEIAATMFREAVCASEIGKAGGLTPEYLVALGADMLTGEAAVTAGLATAVESIETVTARALQLAESPEAREIDNDARAAAKANGADGARRDRAMSLRTGAAPGARAEERKDDEEEDKGTEPTGKCSHCGMQNEDDAKFCDQCGKSMAAKKADEDDDEGAPSSKSPPSSERKSERAQDEKKSAHPPPPERMSAARRMSSTASLASILGATADTPTAHKTAAIEMRHRLDRAHGALVGLTGKDDLDEAIGASLNIPDRLAAGKRAAADLAKMKASADETERWSLADRLVKAQPHMRSKVLADLHDDAGRRIVDDKTGRSVRIRSKYGPPKTNARGEEVGMTLATLRGLVTDLEGDAPKRRTNPFEADKEAAKAASEQAAAENGGGPPMLGASGRPTEAQIKAVTDNLDKHPIVASMWRARGSDPKLLPVIAEKYILAAAQGGNQKGAYG